MLRQIHKYPGLIAGILMMILALGGSVLSVFPALERATVTATPANQTVAQLAAIATPNYPDI
ncbi:MAG: hypothetical protein ACE5DK_01375, partial [Paracoccaceae bacterium]